MVSKHRAILSSRSKKLLKDVLLTVGTFGLYGFLKLNDKYLQGQDKERPSLSEKPIEETPPRTMYCTKCGKELTPNQNYCPRCGNKKPAFKEKSVGAEKPAGEPQKEEKKVSNNWATWGLILGILSVFFYSIGIVPLTALVVSGIGLSKADELGDGKTKAIIGLILAGIYTLMYLASYGHI